METALIIKVMLRQAQHDNSGNPRVWDFFSNLLGYARFTPTGHEGKGRISHAHQLPEKLWIIGKLLFLQKPIDLVEPQAGRTLTQSPASRWPAPYRGGKFRMNERL